MLHDSSDFPDHGVWLLPLPLLLPLPPLLPPFFLSHFQVEGHVAG